jgi:anti-sigma regulatory factor (Ser/Thr protein kinase)
MMAKSGNVELSLPVNMAYLPAIQGFIGELAKTAGLSSKDVDYLLLAVEEAVANVIDHAFLPDEDARFEMVCEHTPLEFTVRIRDKGLPFDPDQVQEFKPRPDQEDISRQGLGLSLMKSSVDKLTFNNLGYEGKEVVLTKFIHQRHIEDYFPPTHLEKFEDGPARTEQPQEKIPYKVQFLQPEQAIEVAQCAYRTYGYTYVMENVYYPERLVQMTLTGDLVSVVAVSEVNGEVMSHCALEFHGQKDGIPEIGMGFTRPKYRGMGCINSINAFILNYARERGIKGIYSKAVTTHTYSQKALNTFKFRPCGLLVGLSPPKKFTRMNKRPNQRETLVLYHRKIIDTPPMEIFIPPSHKKMIERVFRHIGVSVEAALPRTEEVTGFVDKHSHLKCDIDNHRQLGIIHVNKCGKDLEQELHKRLKELCKKKLEAINVYLDLTDPVIYKAITILENQNCYFAGVLPAYPRPFLILQYLNNVYVDYDRIAIYDAFSRELLDYVKDRDRNLT